MSVADRAEVGGRAAGPALAGAPPAARTPLLTRDFIFIWLANFGAFSAYHHWTPTLPLYIVQAGGQASDVGLIVAVMILGGVPARLLGGALLDRYGRKPVLLAGAVVYLLALGAHTWAASPPLIGAVRVFMGIGFSAFSGAAAALVADLVPRARRGEGIAGFSISANFAQATAPALAAAVYAAGGFGPVILLATLTGAAAAIFAALTREPARPAGPPAAPRAGLLSPKGMIVRRALLPSFLLLFLYGGLIALISYIPLYAQEVDGANVGLFFTFFAAGVMASRLGTGRFSDRFGRQAVIFPGALLAALGLLGLGLRPPAPLFLLSGVVVGLGFGAAQPGLVAFTVDRSPSERRGAAMSTYLLAADLGAVTFLPLLGRALPTLGYPGLFGLAGAAVALAVGLYALGLARRL